MFAHLSVAYEFVYTDKHKATKATGFKKFMIKLFAKNMVCDEKSYPKNGRTAPEFIITEEKVFADEKARLIEFMNMFNKKENLLLTEKNLILLAH
tara:strand:+ start:621 stop:905 length:285 start_codon:yes stop_codon:yes gene_type:complete